MLILLFAARLAVAPLAQGAAVPTLPPAAVGGGALVVLPPAHGALVAGRPVVPDWPVQDVLGPGNAVLLCVTPEAHGAAVPAPAPGSGRAAVGIDDGGMFATRD